MAGSQNRRTGKGWGILIAGDKQMKPVQKKEASTVAWRPTIVGSHYAASCGHYLATAAAIRALDAADPRREAYAMAW